MWKKHRVAWNLIQNDFSVKDKVMRSEIGNWVSGIGDRRLEIRNQGSEIGDRRPEQTMTLL